MHSFRHSLLALCLLFVVNTYTWGQTATISKCGYAAVVGKYEQTFPGFIKAQDAYYEQVAEKAQYKKKGKGTIYQIPVVFHVIYNTATQNIDDSCILNQLQILNDAYRHRHADTGKTRDIFKPFAADAEIQFVLATQDPNGNATTGITRTSTNITQFGDLLSLYTNSFDSVERIKFTAQGGMDPWPTTKYLNIWIADMSDPNYGIALLGYATPPMNPLPPNWQAGSFPPLTDGVVLQYQTIGNNNPYVGDLQGLSLAGRTAVHEVGHYLGLRHIGGDAQSCGASTDGIGDTPTMLQSDQKANACQSAVANSCTVGANDTLDMWENYMDYSTDICQTLFTNGQAALMKDVVENQRNTLADSIGVQMTDVKNVNRDAKFTIYPNPASTAIYVDYPGKISSCFILNLMGQTVQKVDGHAIQKREIELNNLAPGTYILQLDAAPEKLYQRFQVK